MLSLSYLFEAERIFWDNVYKKDEAHWVDKKVSNLTKYACKKYGPFKNVLEIGCAAGIDTFYIAQYTTNQVIGIDIAEKAIQLAKQNLEKQPKNIQKKVRFEVGNVEDLRFPKNYFDFIYSLSVLHSTDIDKSFKEIHRVITNNGKAVIYVYLEEEEHKRSYSQADFEEISGKYFNILKTSIRNIPKDAGGDTHKALILELQAKKY